MKTKILAIIIIILFIGLTIMAISSIRDYTTERKNYCEANGGEWPVVGGGNDCLIEENKEIIRYNVVKFKGELRLQR